MEVRRGGRPGGVRRAGLHVQVDALVGGVHPGAAARGRVRGSGAAAPAAPRRRRRSRPGRRRPIAAWQRPRRRRRLPQMQVQHQQPQQPAARFHPVQVLHQGPPPTTYAMAAPRRRTKSRGTRRPSSSRRQWLWLWHLRCRWRWHSRSPHRSRSLRSRRSRSSRRRPPQYVAVSSAAVSQAMAQHAQAGAHQMSQMQNLMAQHAAYQAQQAQQAQQAADEAAAYRAGQEWSLRSGYAAAAAARSSSRRRPPRMGTPMDRAATRPRLQTSPSHLFLTVLRVFLQRSATGNARSAPRSPPHHGRARTRKCSLGRRPTAPPPPR